MTKFSVNFYGVMGGLLTACLFSVMIFAADASFAHPPRQEGGQPAFTAGIQTSELPTCQIKAIVFDQPKYRTGETINLTLELVDHDSNPLPGADVMVDVTKNSADIQSASGFNLIDRVGDYDGTFSNVDIPGDYLFTFTAIDPTGQKFGSCSTQRTVLVEGPVVIITPEIPTTPTTTPETPTTTPETPTSTPETPTATPETPATTPETPTATPETPTATPTGPVVKIEPETLVLNSCTANGSQSVTVQNITNLMAIQAEVAFDPALLQVVDTNPDSDGIQIEAGGVFIDGFVAQNEVDVTGGRVFFAATLVGSDTIEGEAELFTIEWLSQVTGTSSISLENTLLIDSDGQVIETTLQNGSVQIGDTCQSISGSVTLQGRNEYGGVMVTSDAGVQTHTNADGSFSIGGGALLTFQYPGYLSAQANVPALLQSPQAGPGDDFQTTGLGSITLLAGDVNGDQRIDIADLAYIAQNYQSTDPVADFNADGTVNIYDLALAANNFQQQGPLTAWQETN